MKNLLIMQSVLQKIVIVALFCVANSWLCVAETKTEEMNDDSIIAIAAANDFDIDEYMAELESIAGDDYKQYKALQERFGIDEQQREEVEKAKKQRLWLICILSLIIALIPTFTILKKIISGEIKPAGTQAVLKAFGVLLGWGVLLFALNFAWMWVLFSGNTKIMGAVLGVLLFAFVIYAAVSVNKYYKKLDDNNPSK